MTAPSPTPRTDVADGLAGWATRYDAYRDLARYLERILSETQEKLREAEAERQKRLSDDIDLTVALEGLANRAEATEAARLQAEEAEILSTARAMQESVKREAAEAALAAAVEREKAFAVALAVHNDNARSFFAIANRIATELGTHALGTNFGAFAERTYEMLKKYHQVSNDARALSAPQEERGHGSPGKD